MQIKHFHPRVNQSRHGFTLVELLVVISIIAILIALLLPALAKAKSLALRVQCASNMQQDGIAMSEYADEYRGMYPLSSTASWPFGDYASYDNATNSFVNYPNWGFGLLYYASFGIQGSSMVNPRPGILKPTPQGLSMMYSTEPGGFSQSFAFQPGDYTNGIATNWGNAYSGYCYWLDRNINTYSPAEDLSSVSLTQLGITPNAYVSTYDYLPDYYTTDHIPATNPQSNPGDILLTDEVFFHGSVGLHGMYGWPTANTPSSNHVSTANTNFLPTGAHELYNDGAVVWQPLSKLKPRWDYAGLFFGW